jgi:hypothetical protein
MSRKDQTYPKYVKLKIDPDVPPNDLWERGSRQCVSCGINWPNYSIFNPSPCCDQPTNIVEATSELTWAESVKKLLNSRFERYYEKWNEQVTDEALLFDDSVEIPSFDIDKSQYEEGMAEIERLIGESKIES